MGKVRIVIEEKDREILATTKRTRDGESLEKRIRTQQDMLQIPSLLIPMTATDTRCKQKTNRKKENRRTLVKKRILPSAIVYGSIVY